MKRFISIILILCTVFSLSICVHAESQEMKDSADRLHELGLFSGVGTDKDGNPIYDLDRAPTRAEAITMLVRLLGKEAEAKETSWDISFTDVPDWAKPYVGYAYNNKLTLGLNATTFGSTAKVSATQYITFVLRALGYDSGTDFKWDAAWELSDKIGLTDGSYSQNSNNFLRGDVAIISNNSLDVCQKDSQKTLGQALIDNGTISSAVYNKIPQPNMDFFTFTKNSKGYTISGYKFNTSNGEAIDGNYPYLVIPSEYEGMPVTEIDAYIHTYANKIYIPETITYIRENSFENINNCTMFTVEDSNPSYCSVDGVLMTKNQKTLVRYPSAATAVTYEIPSSVTTIAGSAFRGITNYEDDPYQTPHPLQKIIIPSSVTYADQLAFNLSTVELELHANAANWNPYCFSYSLVTMDDSSANFTSFSASQSSESEFAFFPDSAEYAYLGNGVYEIRLNITCSKIMGFGLYDSDRDNGGGYGTSGTIKPEVTTYKYLVPETAFNNAVNFTCRIWDMQGQIASYITLSR